MSWAIGFDSNWQRDIGYGVPACCDHPQCLEPIDRGLSYVCGGEPYGGDRGCGLYFCGNHRQFFERLPELCERCGPRKKKPFKPSDDVPEWIHHKLTHESWAQWRNENREVVARLRETHEVNEL